MKNPRLLPVLVAAAAVALLAWRVRAWIGAARRQPRPINGERGLLEVNRRFYNALWRRSRLVPAHRFNTWPLVAELLPAGAARLEVGAGLRPRLPLPGTEFIDVSATAVAALRRAGARATEASVTALPFADAAFDLVCALDVVEHVEDDDAAFAELARVTKPGGVFLLAVPLFPASWSAFDDFVGHRERYEPEVLARRLVFHGFEIERSAAYGMQTRHPWLAEFGVRCLLQRRERAMWYYTHLIAPLGLLFQPRLRCGTGFHIARGVDEVFLICRRLE